MRPLAEFIMRGRNQAILVAVLSVCSVYFYWIGAAAIALVTLRKGMQQGFVILLWACIPAAILWYQLNEIMPLATVLGAMIGAAQLRWSVSWRAVLITACATGVTTGLLLLLLAGDYLNAFVTAYSTFMAQVEGELLKQGQEQALWFAKITVDKPFVAGIFGVIQTLATVLSVILARWWQSLLYNPGGFRHEFHQLKLSQGQALLLSVAAVGIAISDTSYAVWSSIFALPFVFCGVSLMHATVALRKINGNWLVLFYVLLLVIDEMKLFVAILAFLDCWFDFRKRLSKS